MTKRRFCFAFFLLICFSLPLIATAQTVTIPDSNLRAAIERELGKASGATITRADMANLTELTASNANIRNLTGLEHATDLIYLDLGIDPITFINSNSIQDISPLAGLTKLTQLWLESNNISDISPLARLNNLELLELWGNSISDISALSGLTNLTELWLIDNSISDISALADLINLTELFLGRNSISDISALAGLTNLRWLGIWSNSISDISALAGLTNLRWLGIWSNSISDISPLVANTGLGGDDFVRVTENPLNHASINIHIPALQRRGVEVRFDAVVAEPVDIPDPNLRTAIATTLGKAPGAAITTVDIANLTRLEAPNANITDLTGLEHATNLLQLQLGSERVQGVWTNSNSITDISPVAGLINLIDLSVSRNSITDISPVAGLINLTVLGLGGNSITDISPVENLTNLTRLYLWENPITDISPVAGLINLTVLYLGQNSITDISPVAGLINLTRLFLYDNDISNISPLEGLTNLVQLALDDNAITDISPLVENTGLGSEDIVWLEGNPLNSASLNTYIPALQRRGVDVRFDAAVTEGVNIPDPNLRAAIERTLGKASGATITTADMETLTNLWARNANISDLTGLEHATNLTQLDLRDNSISDISPLAGLNHLEYLSLNGNSISDISPLAGLNKLTILRFTRNSVSDISAVAGLTKLTELYLHSNSISDISPLAGLTNLEYLSLIGNSISDISPLVGLTNLEVLVLSNNSIFDISPVAGLISLAELYLSDNSISDISPVAGLTNLEALVLLNNSISDISSVAGLNNLWFLILSDNSISDISALAGLTNLRTLALDQNSISDILPLVANTGLGSGDEVDVSANPLNSASINTHIPALQSRGVTVEAENLKSTMSEYTLSIPAGISLIHVPLRVTEVDGREQVIERISDLYDALGGTSSVNFLITYDSEAQEWRSFFVSADRGGPADAVLTDDTGIIAGLNVPMSIRLSGNPLGTDGNSSLNLSLGLNVVGLPLDDSRITRVSDLLTLEGISGNVPVIILTDGGEFKLVGRASDPGDIEITGGQSFIMTAQRAATVNISGDAWANDSGTAAAPPVTLKGVEVGDTTPVLGLRGTILDEGTGLKAGGFRVTVKNLSTGRAVAAVTTPDEAGYRATAVDIETGRAAMVGDILEISARSPNPFVGVESLRYTITAEDVKQSLIQLPNLFAYEIPAETQLLHNYPNPFNPETWIPYRLAEDAFVTLTIYDGMGQIVRTIDVGHQVAAVYESRSKAIYWDGRNELGEQVVSGVYFYHLFAGRSGLSVPHRSDYSTTRKMVILK